MANRNRHKWRFKDNPNVKSSGNTIGDMLSKSQIIKLKKQTKQDDNKENTKTNKGTT
jgi:hypothetical protein